MTINMNKSHKIFQIKDKSVFIIYNDSMYF